MIADRANTILLVTIFILVTVVTVFGMKYFTAARQARLRVTGEDAYRELAAASAAAQAAGASALAGVQADLAEIKARLTSLEKILREVE